MYNIAGVLLRYGYGPLAPFSYQCTHVNMLHCQLTNPPSHVNTHGSDEAGSLLQFTLGVGQPPAVQFTVMFPDELRVRSILCIWGFRYVRPSTVKFGTNRNGFSIQYRQKQVTWQVIVDTDVLVAVRVCAHSCVQDMHAVCQTYQHSLLLLQRELHHRFYKNTDSTRWKTSLCQGEYSALQWFHWVTLYHCKSTWC